MRFIVKHADVLDEPADVLVCSANPFLNLSGGVGGALRERYGDAMQVELHEFLATRGLNFVASGDVVGTASHGAPYKRVLHAVGIDAFYDSNPTLVTKATSRALDMAAEIGASRVTMVAIATGYGRMCLEDFAAGLRPLIGRDIPPIEQVAVCLRKADDAAQLQELIFGT